MVDGNPLIGDRKTAPAPEAPVPVSRLGVGGAMLLHTLRHWVWCFSAGHYPPPCLAASFVQAGCHGVPSALLRLLRTLRASPGRKLYFNAPSERVLTATEHTLMQAFAAACRRAPRELESACKSLVDASSVSEARLSVSVVGHQLVAAKLGIWGDTILLRVSAPADKFCEFCAPAHVDSTVFLGAVHEC